MSALATAGVFAARTGQMSALATEEMSAAVETGRMPAAATGETSTVEKKQMYTIVIFITGQTAVAIVDICLFSAGDVCLVSTADIGPASTADI